MKLTCPPDRCRDARTLRIPRRECLSVARPDHMEFRVKPVVVTEVDARVAEPANDVTLLDGCRDPPDVLLTLADTRRVPVLDMLAIPRDRVFLPLRIQPLDGRVDGCQVEVLRGGILEARNLDARLNFNEQP